MRPPRSTLTVTLCPFTPLFRSAVPLEEARRKAEGLLARVNIPAAMWDLAPATFSGGEQQRVNIARGFAADYPILLLDEPTASLDAGNRAVVVALINEAKARGAARSAARRVGETCVSTCRSRWSPDH